MKRTNADLKVCWPTVTVITLQHAPEVTVIATAAQESRSFFLFCSLLTVGSTFRTCALEQK